MRSRLLLPPDAPEARTAQAEAEALRRLLHDRAAIRHTAEWLARRTQLGRHVFARGGMAAGGAARATNITDLFRACLVALRVPEQDRAYQLRFRKLWRVAVAMARITGAVGGAAGGWAAFGFPAACGPGTGPCAALPGGARQHFPVSLYFAGQCRGVLQWAAEGPWI